MSFKVNLSKSIFLMALLWLITFSQLAFALSPPWYLLRALLKTSLEADPCVKVGNLTGEGRNMEVLINVCEFPKAQALSTLVSKQHSFGDKLMVTVKVMFANQLVLPGPAPSKASEVIALINDSLRDNQFFVKSLAAANSQMGFAEFKPAVVQFFADDISDWYRNTNLVAADAFKKVLDVKALRDAGILLYVTTSRIN